ncbi:MAG: GIY-YIG nuclease family protein [Anaerolineales bacterium]
MIISTDVNVNKFYQRVRFLLGLGNAKGSYALVLKLPRAEEITVGSLGTFYFPKGTYIYCGSAFGNGGVSARLNHHFRELTSFSPQSNWHIDYFISSTRLPHIYYSLSPTPLECIWSQSLAKLPGAFIPAKGFGATDCKQKCPAHLIGFPPGYRSEKWLQALKVGEQIIQH